MRDQIGDTLKRRGTIAQVNAHKSNRYSSDKFGHSASQLEIVSSFGVTAHLVGNSHKSNLLEMLMRTVALCTIKEGAQLDDKQIENVGKFVYNSKDPSCHMTGSAHLQYSLAPCIHSYGLA